MPPMPPNQQILNDHEDDDVIEEVFTNHVLDTDLPPPLSTSSSSSDTDDDESTPSASSTDRKVLRCAILGCGMMGQEHCSYIMGYPNDLQIVYLCDPHQPSIDKCLDIINSDNTVSCHQATIVHDEDILLEEYANDIDLLVVATPNFLHAQSLMKWGIHQHLTILLEKPAAVSKEQHDQLLQFANTGNLKANVWIAMEYRYIPAIAKLIELLPTIGDIKMITIRENRYPFLHKIENWNRDRNKTGDTLVEKCCHFFDLMRLITGQEANLDKMNALVQRGLNYECEDIQHPIPIIDSAYVTMPFVNKKNSNNNSNNGKKSGILTQQTIGCLELCMYAEGSRHQEEVIVTGTQGRLEAYLPENTVYQYQRPTHQKWQDRSVPPPTESINYQVYDCSNVKRVHLIDDNITIPTHGGYHYCSTAIEWYKLLNAVRKHDDKNDNNNNVDNNRNNTKTTESWKPEVSLMDGLRAVEIGLRATQEVEKE